MKKVWLEFRSYNFPWKEDQERQMGGMAKGADNFLLPWPLLGTFMGLSHSS